VTEDEARAWVRDSFDVPRETIAALDRFISLLRGEAAHQNLVAASTLDQLWYRHIVDSAQLLSLAPKDTQTWVDLGSGAGFPGLIVAALSRAQVTLIESRRKRLAFLASAIACLGLEGRVTLIGGRVESVRDRRFDVISARAFAPLDRLFTAALDLADPRTTQWLLPKGRSARAELEAARGSWQGSFRVEPSITESDAGILVAAHVRPRKHR
jgi:16S rRNA (guanine527-N7)-methyltransferase